MASVRPRDPVAEAEGADDASTMRNVRETLVRLPETTNTETGRQIATGRYAYLEAIVERFEREWRGEL